MSEITVKPLSQIVTPDGQKYLLRDSSLRTILGIDSTTTTTNIIPDIYEQLGALSAGGVTIAVSTNAANTPAGVQWKSGSTTITGTLAANADAAKNKIYFVPCDHTDDDSYDEYLAIGGETKVWEKIGNTHVDLAPYAKTADLKALAYKDTVAVEYDKVNANTGASTQAFVTSATVGSTFAGTTATISTSYTPAGSVTVTPTVTLATTTFKNVTAAALSATPTFTGTTATLDLAYTPEGDVAVTPTIALTTTSFQNVTAAALAATPTFTGTTTTLETSYTPAGTISKPGITLTSSTVNYVTGVSSATATGAFAGTAATITPSFSTATVNSTGSYKPAGGVTVTPTVTLNTVNVYSITDVGSLPTHAADTYQTTTYTYDAAEEALTIVAGTFTSGAFSQGELPTKGSAQAVATSVKSASATASFAGTTATISVASSAKFVDAIEGVSYTPAGDVTVTPTVTLTTTSFKNVTAAALSATPTFSGTTATISIGYTPEGTVSKPAITLTSSAVNYVTGVDSISATAAFTGTSATLSTTYKPAGTVSKPSITLTSSSVTYATGTVSAATATAEFAGTTATIEASYKPEGDVTSTFHGTTATHSHTIGTSKANGSVSYT